MTLLGWMAYALAVGGLLSAAAWCLDRGLERAGLPVRWVWAGALALSVAIPLATVLADTLPSAGDREAGPLPIETAAVQGASAPEAEMEQPGLLHRVAAIPGVTAGALNQGLERAIGALPVGPGAGPWLAGLWTAGSAGLGLLLLLAVARARGRRKRWPRARVRGRDVRIAPDLGPAVVGLLRPEIVLPRWTTALDSREVELILAHEDEHVRAHDPLLLAAALLPLVALPWNPAIWWQLRRLRDAVELDCDRRVLRGGAAPKPYGTLLVRLGGRGGQDLLPAAALAGTPSLLERRLSVMKRRSVRTAVPVTLLAAALAVGLVALACEADAPTQPAGDAEAVQAQAENGEDGAEGQYEMISVLPHIEDDEDRPLYVVDGVIVSQEVINELDTDRIEHVEVLKGAAAGAVYGTRAPNGVVAVATVDGDGAGSGPLSFTVSRVDREGAGSDRLPYTVHRLDQEDADVEAGGYERSEPLRLRERGSQPEDVTPEEFERRQEALEALEETRAHSEEAEAGRLELRGNVAGAAVRLRERTSEPPTNAERPLIVIDGVVTDADRVDLDALDIESMEVLKGEAAIEEYGSRAANGVIMIVTK